MILLCDNIKLKLKNIIDLEKDHNWIVHNVIFYLFEGALPQLVIKSFLNACFTKYIEFIIVAVIRVN